MNEPLSLVRPGTRWAGCSLVHRDITGSTNDDVRAEIDRGAPHGFTVVADAQRAGRGRAGRVWHSPAGVNLYLSTLVRLPESPAHPPTLLTLGTGLAVADALAPFLAPTVPRVKWPNDVRANGKKLAGVLLEGVVRGGAVRAIVAGVGMNVNANPDDFPSSIGQAVTSVRAVTGRVVSRAAVLESFLRAWEARVDAWMRGDANSWPGEFTARCDTIGTLVRAGELEGVARSIEPDGALVLDTADGPRRVLCEVVGAHDATDRVLLAPATHEA